MTFKYWVHKYKDLDNSYLKELNTPNLFHWYRKQIKIIQIYKA